MTDTADTLKTILVVEDTPMFIERIVAALQDEGYLEETGYRVVSALTDAPKAIQAYRDYQDSICLIVLDAKLENDTNGLHLLDAIKLFALPLPPTIAHSTLFNDQLCAAGASHEVLKKPDMTNLIAVVREILPIQ